MEQHFKSNHALRDFVSDHYPQSNVKIDATVSIKTSKHSENKAMELLVYPSDSESFGRIVISSDLDTDFYPTEFQARYQEMEYIDGKYLKISGKHKHNPNIGEYKVEIFPLS